MSWGNIEDFGGFEQAEPSKATTVQVGIIEQLLVVAAIPEVEKEDIDTRINSLSEEEAYYLIKYLKENETFKDPLEQYKNHLKNKL